MKKRIKSCWIITEGMAGTENQCIGVAEALGVGYEIKRITLKQPWKMFSPWLGFECGASFTPALLPPWPDLLIASGRKSVAASRYIKRKSGGKTFTLQIQNPHAPNRDFDMLAIPKHDGVTGKNVIQTDTAPNRINDKVLEKTHGDFEHLFGSFGKPVVAVLIGGNTKDYKITPEIVRKLAGSLSGLGVSPVVTCSRRTGKENTKILEEELEKAFTRKDYYFWNGKGEENPYMGMLAWADFILVTEDSVSMVSDAVSTGKPVYIIPLEGENRRIGLFHKNLEQKGVTRYFHGKLEEWSYEPINTSRQIAESLRKRLGIG